VEGTVEVLFTVGKEGGVTDLRVLRGIGYDCDEEVIRAIKHAKKWKPAFERDSPVAEQQVIAVQFKLTDNL
jgi:protein TonB